MSGIYSVMDYYKHEKMQAVEYVSTMHKATDGVENFDYYSPTSLLKKLNEGSVETILLLLFLFTYCQCPTAEAATH